MVVDGGRVSLDAAAVVRCRRRVHLDHDPAAVAAARAAPDPALAQRRADAVAHRENVGRRLAELVGPGAAAGAGAAGEGAAGGGQAPGREAAAAAAPGREAADTAAAPGRLAADAAAPGWVEVPDGPSARRQAATRAAVEAGAAYIWNAALPPDVEGGRWGDAELLVRAPGRDGRAGYRPLIVVRHRVTDPGSGALTSPLARPHAEHARPDERRRVRSHPRDQLRLAHLTRMVAAMGAAPPGPAYGAVIGMDADVVVWHELSAPTWPGGHSTLAEYDARFADRVAVAAAAASGGAALAVPSRVTECRRCPWWPTCEAELTARGDVSLVLRGEDAATVRAHGVTTVAQLAALDPGRPLPVPLHGMPFADAVALARAFQRGLPVVRRVAEVPVPRADVEVDVDMESFGESGAYLWGALLSGADIGESAGYRGFATWEPLPTDDEARSFAEFWGWLSGVRTRCARAGLSFAAYCYNEQAENRWMLASADRFAGKPGVPPRAEVAEFIASGQWVDMFAVVSRWFLCAHGKGLKRVAPVAGFTWADPEASGENSMRWYRDAVGLDGAAPDAAQRERLLRYNADDTAATQVLRQWMRSPDLTAIPLAHDL
ncbi:MAG: TM0106 family RecB-like putative nuclease [Pseudonocardia sp.]